MQHLLAAVAAAALTAFASAQVPGITTFGTGCAIQGQQLAMSHRGTPQLGGSFDLIYSGPNFVMSSGQQRAWPFLALGFRVTNIPIPPVFMLQPPGCTILIVPELSVPMQPDPTGRPVFRDTTTWSVPNDPSLRGATMFAQWFLAFDQCGFAGCNLAAVGTSNAAAITFGP